MSPERFHTLLQTYGAELRRWPEAERTAAAHLAEHGPPELRRALAEAAQLDHWLDSHAVPEATPALLQRIAAGNRARRRAPAWWAGAGLATIGLAGSLAGAFAVSLALQAVPGAEWPQPGTAFGGLPTEGSEE